jgi:hypothetical protein
MEKKTNVRADVQKKIQEIIKRIEAEKAELRAEIEKTQAELRARETGTTKASGFNVKDILENDDNEVTERLKSKIAKLENALAKPMYADAEFRKYSLIYLKGELEAYTEENNILKTTIGRMEHDLIVIPQQLRAVEREKITLLDGFYSKAIAIGIGDAFSGIIHGANYAMSEYEELCSKYEAN